MKFGVAGLVMTNPGSTPIWTSLRSIDQAIVILEKVGKLDERPQATTKGRYRVSSIVIPILPHPRIWESTLERLGVPPGSVFWRRPGPSQETYNTLIYP